MTWNQQGFRVFVATKRSRATFYIVTGDSTVTKELTTAIRKVQQTGSSCVGCSLATSPTCLIWSPHAIVAPNIEMCDPVGFLMADYMCARRLCSHSFKCTAPRRRPEQRAALRHRQYLLRTPSESAQSLRFSKKKVMTTSRTSTLSRTTVLTETTLRKFYRMMVLIQATNMPFATRVSSFVHETTRNLRGGRLGAWFSSRERDR